VATASVARRRPQWQLAVTTRRDDQDGGDGEREAETVPRPRTELLPNAHVAPQAYGEAAARVGKRRRHESRRRWRIHRPGGCHPSGPLQSLATRKKVRSPITNRARVMNTFS